jgi:type II secretory pathway component PulC
MSSANLQRAINLSLALLCLLGALLVILELSKWPFWGAAPGSADKVAPQSGSKHFPAKAQKVGNPFARTPQASALPVTSPETGITVYGVIISPEGSIVLARAGSEGIKQFKSGQSLGGFRIKEVQADRLVLQKGENGPTQTIRWLKREDYLSQPHPSPKLPPSRGQISTIESDKAPHPPPPPPFNIKPGPQQKFEGGNR